MSGRPPAAFEPQVLGQRLREARERTGISLRRLAQRVGLSASAVSQIETGAIAPSVKTLYALATELAVSLDDLLGHPARKARMPAGVSDARWRRIEQPVVHRRDREILQVDAGVRWERLTSRPDPLLDFLKVTYEPGAETRAHGRLTPSGGVELGVILTGHLDLTVGSDTHGLGPGDSVSLDWGEPHLLANNGSALVSCIWVMLPDGFDRMSLRRLGSFAGTLRREPARDLDTEAGQRAAAGSSRPKDAHPAAPKRRHIEGEFQCHPPEVERSSGGGARAIATLIGAAE